MLSGGGGWISGAVMGISANDGEFSGGELGVSGAWEEISRQRMAVSRSTGPEARTDGWITDSHFARPLPVVRGRAKD